LSLDVEGPSGGRVVPTPRAPTAPAADWVAVGPGESRRFRCESEIGDDNFGQDLVPGLYSIRFRGVDTDQGRFPPPSEPVTVEITGRW
jgi:hypothetical protein